MTPFLLAVAFAAAVLFQGPLSFGPLTALLERQLDAAVPQLGVRIDDAVLSWNRDAGRLEVQVLNARLLDDKGVTLAAFSRASIDFNGEDLLFGRLVPEGVEVWKPRLHLYRDNDGEFYLQAQGQSRRWSLAVLIQGLADATQSAGTTILQPRKTRTIRLTAHQAELSIEDVRLGIKAYASNASLAADYSGGTASLSFASVMNIGGEEISIGLGVVRRQGESGYEASVRFEGARASKLYRLLPIKQLQWLTGAEVDLAGRVDFYLGDDGEIPFLDIDLKIGAGTISMPEYFPAPLQLKSGILRCRFDDNYERLLLSNVDAEFADGLHLYFAGEMSGLSSQPSVVGAGGLENLPAERIKQYWPLGLAGTARTWVAKNILGGDIAKGEFRLDIKRGELAKPRLRDQAVEFTWRFENVRTTYMKNMPALQQGRGKGLVTGQRFELTVDKARSNDILISQGSLLVPDIYARPNELQIDFVAEGPVASMASLLEREPLRLASRMGISPAAVDGHAWVKSKLKLPLKKSLEFSDIELEIAAQLQGFASDRNFGDYRLSDGVLSLKADDERISIFGNLKINGVAGELGWTREFGSAGSDGDRLKIKMRLDDNDRSALGLDFGAMVRGSVWAEGEFRLRPQRRIEGNVRLNLAAAEIVFEDIKWRKAPGVAANMEVDFLRRGDGGTSFSRLALRAGDLVYLGAGALDENNKLLRLNAQLLRFGKNDLEFDLSWRSDGATELEIRGRQLDVRGYFDDNAAVEEPQGVVDDVFHLNIRVDRVLAKDDLALSDIRVSAVRRGGIWSKVNARAKFARGAQVRMVVKSTGEARQLLVFSQDAGALARALGVSKSMVGGKLRIDATLPLRQDWQNGTQGTVRAANFKVLNAPSLGRMLTLGSFTGISDAMDQKGVAFRRLELPFVLKGSTLSITGARAIGPALGLTANIQFDRASEQIKAEGMIVPAYSINSVLGSIPIIGNILIGRPGEGVFAMKFRAQGPWEDPKISVNPLSVLAPGFLRNIVTGFEELLVPGDDKPDNR